ncbi:MAG: SapC family protein [Candidatus Eutrophobiaceae bacterium]
MAKTTQSNPSLPLFYKETVALDKEQHRDLCLAKSNHFLYAAKANSVQITAVEFGLAAREYPVVFAVDSSATEELQTVDNPDATPTPAMVFPVALLSVDEGRNFYVDAKGQWSAKYIPAYVRRYPFILATNPQSSDSLTVCIDPSYNGFNTDGQGERLFDEHGKEGKILSTAIEFLGDYQAQINRTTQFCATLRQLGILHPMQANFKVPGGQERSLRGFWGVDREKLLALEESKIADLVRNGYLELIYAHLWSLGNVDAFRQVFNEQAS